MIKRTAQEWADFTGCKGKRLLGSLYFYDENDFQILRVSNSDVLDFCSLEHEEEIHPSEPCVLIPTRLLEEASELIQRMNSALDGKIKENEAE